MPSKYQAAPTTRHYDSEAKKMVATKNDMTLNALIRGMVDADRAREYIQAEVDVAAEEDRKPRKKLIGALNRRIDAIEDDSVEPEQDPISAEG